MLAVSYICVCVVVIHIMMVDGGYITVLMLPGSVYSIEKLPTSVYRIGLCSLGSGVCMCVCYM